ncbi:MAG TPA: MBL fold metallo-hydrolase [Candidatus Angelobacter sp.]|jgi:glyoxylase-like metal-dependent hydrolase (beta-lactamase superfamily II)
MRPSCARIIAALAFLLHFITACVAKDYGKVTSQKVADGVYLFTTAPYGDVGLCGNSVAVLSDDGVLVFDSGATPQTAATILTEIRKLTDKPVRYLVNSHWHWDHWGGNQVYLAANPGLQIISHEKTRELMLNVEPRWNEKGLKEDLPQFLDGFEKQIAAAKARNASAERIQAAEERLEADRNFLAQKQSLRKTYPNVTFSASMTLLLGSREIQILHAHAITPGDTYIFLPKEKTLITGDILLSPYPFAIGGTYPANWSQTLEKLVALEPSVIIPGHGDAETTSDFLRSNLALFQELLRQVKEAKSRGLTLDQTSEALSKENTDLAARIGIKDSETVEAFKAYFLDVFVKRAYRELDGPLGDLPDGIR